MNYYPFHMGDYATATRHLSWDEDAAYRRLLDAYYTHEKPLPVEMRAVFRLVIATTDAQREAVETVLREFFTLTDEGWHNKRADVELAEMRVKQDEQAIRADHEADRMRRHRERRAEMFAALRAVGIVPAWDVSIKELQRLHDQHTKQPATDLKREQAVSADTPATAIPTPTPTPTPTPSLKKDIARKRAKPVSLGVDELVAEGVERQHAADWVTARAAKHLPLTRTALDDTKAEAEKAGMTLPEAIRTAAANGWGGFKASWLDKHEAPRVGNVRPLQRNGEPAWRTEQRERMAQFAGPFAEKPRAQPEPIDVVTRIVD